MLQKLTDFYIKQLFFTNFISLFINPFYIIRSRLLKNLKPLAFQCKGKLLDFGCGLKPYQKLFVNVENYIGIDIENEGHSHEKEMIDVFYDGKKLPFNDASFDTVFCSEVLEHVFNIDEILPEINRVLKVGGIFLVTIPFAWDEHEIPNDFGRYTSFGISHLLEKNGFHIENFTKSGSFFEVVVQLFILYLHHLLFTKNKYVNIFINFIFISPLTILGLFFSFILPKKKSLYFNNVVFCSKKN